MRRVTSIFIILTIAVCSFAGSLDKTFADLSKIKGATYINLPVPIIRVAASQSKENDILNKIDGIKIINLDKCGKKEIKKAEKIFGKCDTSGFEPIVETQEKDKAVKIMARSNDDSINDIVIYDKSRDSFTIMLISGNLTLNDIEDLKSISSITSDKE